MDRIGIDLGGTKIEGILLAEDYSVLSRIRIPTNQELGYSHIVNSIHTLITKLQNESSHDCTIGVCTPGIISSQTGLIKNSNTQCLIGKPLQKDLELKINKTILMENDANCFALAESKLGAAKNFNVVFGVIMGTGVGGGIIIDGEIHHGRNNIAGEWGHHIIRPDGLDCYCGKKGCVETCICGPALEKKWQKLTGQIKSMPQIIRDMSSDIAQKWKLEFLEDFVLGISNVIDILDPDVVVLGGGLSNISFLYDEGASKVNEMVFSDSVNTPILKNQLGDSAGVFGACLLK